MEMVLSKYDTWVDVKDQGIKLTKEKNKTYEE
jgi:hypothetical protein